MDNEDVWLTKEDVSASILEFDIPYGVTTIGCWSFADCTGLSKVTIPPSVTMICSDAFYNCRGLESVTIPDSVNYIGEHSFRGCTCLKSITILGSETKFGNDVFDKCPSLTILAPKDSYAERYAKKYHINFIPATQVQPEMSEELQGELEKLKAYIKETCFDSLCDDCNHPGYCVCCVNSGEISYEKLERFVLKELDFIIRTGRTSEIVTKSIAEK